eukprot:scaffold117045_cov32-Tisochrysis_lutea.AAC.1
MPPPNKMVDVKVTPLPYAEISRRHPTTAPTTASTGEASEVLAPTRATRSANGGTEAERTVAGVEEADGTLEHSWRDEYSTSRLCTRHRGGRAEAGR